MSGIFIHKNCIEKLIMVIYPLNNAFFTSSANADIPNDNGAMGYISGL